MCYEEIACPACSAPNIVKNGMAKFSGGVISEEITDPRAELVGLFPASLGMRIDLAIAELEAKGVTVAIARLSHEQAQHEAGRSGLLEIIGRHHVFMSVEEAVQKLGPGSRAEA